MRVIFLLVGSAVFGLACTATTSGTGTPDDTTGPPGSPTAKTPPTAPPGNPPAANPPPPAAKAHLRFANAAYQTGAVDFCVRNAQGAATWEGPLLSALGVKGGADQGLMTRAFERDAGSWDVAVVTSKATNCDKPIVSSKTPVSLASGGGALVVLRGNGGVSGAEALGVTTLPEESTAPAAGKARVRFFHASPNWEFGKASVLLGATETFSDVAFGELAKSSSVGTPSAAGYVDVSPSGGEITVDGLEDFNGPRTVYGQWTPKAGARITLLLEGAAGSGFFPPTVVACPDDDTLATADDAVTACD
jgi:hypothetical protein